MSVAGVRTQTLPRAASVERLDAAAAPASALSTGSLVADLPVTPLSAQRPATSGPEFLAMAQLLAGLGWASHDGSAPWYPWLALASGPVCDRSASLVA